MADAGVHVMCAKPMTFDLAQAEELAKVVHKSGVVFGVTHNYTGYPLVRQARDMVLSGELGEINAVRAFYIQGWLRTRLESENQKQAGWRTDPTKSGAAGCFGDIGTHAYNLSRFITGLLPDQISCVLNAYVEGRPLDDYGTAILRYQNGALGTVTASQISHGRENDLWIEVDGTKGALEWHQEEPNKMLVRVNGQPHRIYTRAGGPYLGATAAASSRIPAGHPEAFLEAFANVYTAAYNDMIKRAGGETFDGAKSLYPNVADGVDGMNFITQCVTSSKNGGQWLSLKHPLCRA
jgi:predicted dehydrogenase